MADLSGNEPHPYTEDPTTFPEVKKRVMLTSYDFQSCTTKSEHRDVQRICSRLRKNIYKESKRFTRLFPKHVESIMKTMHPSDPLSLETPEPLEVQRKKQTLLNNSRLRQTCSWNDFEQFHFAVLVVTILPDVFTLFATELVISQLGLLFLVPFIVGWFVVSNPIMQLELCLGQIFRSGPFKIFYQINKRFVGMGLLTALILVPLIQIELWYSVNSLKYQIGTLRKSTPWGVTHEIFETCTAILDPQECELSSFCHYSSRTAQCAGIELKTADKYFRSLFPIGKVGRESQKIRLEKTSCIIIIGTLCFCLFLLVIGPAVLGPLCCFTSLGFFTTLSVLAIVLYRGETPPGRGVYDSINFLLDFIDGKKWMKLLNSPGYWFYGVYCAMLCSQVFSGVQYTLGGFCKFGRNMLYTGKLIFVYQIGLIVLTASMLENSLKHQEISIEYFKNNLGSQDLGFSYFLLSMFLDRPTDGRIFGAALFFFMYLQTVLRITLMGLGVVLLMHESRGLHNISFKLISFFFTIVIFGVSLFQLLTIRNHSYCYTKVRSLCLIVMNIALPILGILQLYFIDNGRISHVFRNVFGEERRQQKIVLRAGTIAVVNLTVFLLIELVILDSKFSISSFFLFVLSSFFTTSILAAASRQTEALSESDEICFYCWTVAGFDTLRELINELGEGTSINRTQRLSISWVITVALISPSMVSNVLAYSLRSSMVFKYFRKGGTDFTVIMMGIVFASTVVVLVLSGIVVPDWYSLSAPPSMSNWDYKDIPKRNPDTNYVIRRIPLFFLEEFLPLHKIWNRSTKVQLIRIRD